MKEQMPQLQESTAHPVKQGLEQAIQLAGSLKSEIAPTPAGQGSIIEGIAATGRGRVKAIMDRATEGLSRAASKVTSKAKLNVLSNENARRKVITAVAGVTAVAATYGAYRYLNRDKQPDDPIVPPAPAPRPAKPKQPDSPNPAATAPNQAPATKPDIKDAPTNDPDTQVVEPAPGNSRDKMTTAEKLQELEQAVEEFNSYLVWDGQPTTYVPSPEHYSKMVELAKAIKMTGKGAIGYTAYGKKLNSFAARSFLDNLNPKKWILSGGDTGLAERIITQNDRSIAVGGNTIPRISHRGLESQLLSIDEFRNRLSPRNRTILIHEQLVINAYRDYVDSRLDLSEELKDSNPDYQAKEAPRYDTYAFVQQDKTASFQTTRKVAKSLSKKAAKVGAIIKDPSGVLTETTRFEDFLAEHPVHPAGVKMWLGEKALKLSGIGGQALDILDKAHSKTRERISRTIESNDRKAMLGELEATPVKEMEAKADAIKVKDEKEMQGTWTLNIPSARVRQAQFRKQVNNLVSTKSK